MTAAGERVHHRQLGAVLDDKLRLALIKRRQQLRLTQTALAGRMSTSQSAVSDFESGRCSPRLETLIRWAAALDLNLLVGFEDLRDPDGFLEMFTTITKETS